MSHDFKINVLTAKIKVSELTLDLEKAKRELSDLLKTCPHEWKDSPKGYEHEGKFCSICGISDLTIKR